MYFIESVFILEKFSLWIYSFQWPLFKMLLCLSPSAAAYWDVLLLSLVADKLDQRREATLILRIFFTEQRLEQLSKQE